METTRHEIARSKGSFLRGSLCAGLVVALCGTLTGPPTWAQRFAGTYAQNPGDGYDGYYADAGENVIRVWGHSPGAANLVGNWSAYTYDYRWTGGVWNQGFFDRVLGRISDAYNHGVTSIFILLDSACWYDPNYKSDCPDWDYDINRVENPQTSAEWDPLWTYVDYMLNALWNYRYFPDGRPGVIIEAYNEARANSIYAQEYWLSWAKSWGYTTMISALKAWPPAIYQGSLTLDTTSADMISVNADVMTDIPFEGIYRLPYAWTVSSKPLFFDTDHNGYWGSLSWGDIIELCNRGYNVLGYTNVFSNNSHDDGAMAYCVANY